MKITEQLPSSKNALLLGPDGGLFSCLPRGIEEAPSLPGDRLPHTVFLGHRKSPEGLDALGECIKKEIPFVVAGRGWSRGIPSSAVPAGGNTRIIGPGSAGLLVGPAPAKTVLLAAGSEIFSAVVKEAKARSVPIGYGLSFGKKSAPGPLNAARIILESSGGGQLLVFIKKRLSRGRDLLEFAAEAARRGSLTALLEYDPLPGEDEVEEAALRQMGIIVLDEPSDVVDMLALFRAFDGRLPAGIIPDLGRGEMAALVRNEGSRRSLPFAPAEDDSLPRLKIAQGASGLCIAGRKKTSFIPGIKRGLDALSLMLAAAKARPGTAGDMDGPGRCPIHPRPTEYDAKILLKTFGIPVARERLCRSFREASEAADIIGYPVAVKVMSPAILHKSEARVIALNLHDEEELRNAYGRTLEKARIANPGAKIRGVLVQEMVRGGSEWRMEFRRDPRFGPVVEICASGVYGEILSDGVIRVAPFSEEEAAAMIAESRGRPLLLEGWMRKRLDKEAFASALSAFSKLAFCEREVSRLEVNPIFVNRKGVLVVDAFLELKGREK